MIDFLKKVILFSLPVLGLFLFPSVVILTAREYVSFKDIVHTQEVFPESLFGFAYNGVSFYPYKEYLVRTKDPEVIALGTSRVMQFRKEFFTKDSVFINAGGAGKSLEDMENFVRNLPNQSSVRVIILGLDREILIGPYLSQDKKEEDLLPIRFSKIAVLMSRRIYLDYANKKFFLKDIFSTSKSTNHIGLVALLHGDGFRADGSYKYGSATKNLGRVSYVESQIKSYIETSANFSNKDTASVLKNLEQNLRAVERIILLAKEKNITIVGIMPPYPTPVHQIIKEQDKTLVTLSLELSEIFKKKGFSFFDFSSIEVFGGKETEFVDAIHGTDVMYLKMVIYMAEHSNSLDAYINVPSLVNILKKIKGDFLEF